MFAQTLAHRMKIPGIVLLLAIGVLLGPDVTGILHPDVLGGALEMLVGFAVAVILFEGGMRLNIRRLRREAKSIRRLVTLGAFVTAVGGAFAARWILQWSWTLSILFGTLVIVTGPTVIVPLLQRIRLKHKLSTLLEAEGVLIDPVGAIVAVVALEVAISPSRGSFALAPWDLASRLGFGLIVGILGGLLIAALLRSEICGHEGSESVLTLSIVFLIFQGSNSVLAESGIMSVTVAGLLVGNVKTRVLRDVREFKEQVTVMLIGLLFVLLAAEVRLDEVRSLGWAGVATVLVLMFIVRPIGVYLCTRGTGLTQREKLFMSWLAPRGIVAAAVSSLFAHELELFGIEGGSELRAMVFLVIAMTVLIQGLTGGFVADLLGVRRPSNYGYVILGANKLGLAIGRLLRNANEEVIYIDSNPDAYACRYAGERDFRVLFGSAVSESTLRRAELDSRAGSIAVTSNDELNFIFARRCREEFKLDKVWMALRQGHVTVNPSLAQKLGAKILFGGPRNLDLWTVRLERGEASVENWRRTRTAAAGDPPQNQTILPLVSTGPDGSRSPVNDTGVFATESDLWIAIAKTHRDEALAWLDRAGWERVPAEASASPVSSPAA